MAKLTIETPEVFEPLLQPSRYKGAHGGRGSGKSHFFGELTIEEHVMYPGLRTVCVREVQKSLKESMKRLLEDKIESLGVGSMFKVLTDRIITPGDGLIVFNGMQDHTADSIKSLEGFDRALVEEAQTLSARSLELLRPTIRAAGSELRFIWNPRNARDPVDSLLRGIELPPSEIVVRANYSDNPWFPDELEIEREFDKKNSPDRYAHIWLGEYEPQAIGAIWNMANIHENRVHEAPTMGRILVSVDPAVTSPETNASGKPDEHGILVGGIGEDGRGYVIDDVSLKGSPQQWAERAVAAFDRYDADCVVIEKNQGGDMCKHTLKTVRPSLPVETVTATRGKHVRAEPISSLYGMNQISHVGTFQELESQMCRMTAAGYEGDGSADRVDALVWMFTKLFPSMVNKSKPRSNRPRLRGGWMG